MNNILKSVNICTIGGGTGSSVLLRGLKNCSDFLTAIVTVSDDGGSSGRLRRLIIFQVEEYREHLIVLCHLQV